MTSKFQILCNVISVPVNDTRMQGSRRYHKFLCLASLFTCLLSLILHIIAFSTSYWIASDGDSPFQNLGFHEACFSNCHFPYCPGDPDIIFNGCYTWTFNELIFSNDQFREIVDWLMPPWFMTCKNLFTSNIAILFVCCILLLICTCWAFRPLYRPTTPHKKDICAITMGFLTLMMLLISTLINVSGIALFSSVAPHRKYMPMTYKNHFGYSFWLDFSVCIILSISAFLTYLSTISKVIHYIGPKDTKYSDEMMLGRI